jgi:hypothetical protein
MHLEVRARKNVLTTTIPTKFSSEIPIASHELNFPGKCSWEILNFLVVSQTTNIKMPPSANFYYLAEEWSKTSQKHKKQNTTITKSPKVKSHFKTCPSMASLKHPKTNPHLPSSILSNILVYY